VSSKQGKTIEWDGEALIGWITIKGKSTKVRATREIIHNHAPGFNDAITWEIEHYRFEIFDKLTPFLIETNG
jgi:hypothetical protein